MKIGICGGSGVLGGLAVQAALERVPAGDLVITSRTPGALAAYAQRGVSVRYADFNEPQSLPGAFDGIERMFMMSVRDGAEPHPDQHGPAIRAARAAGVARIVFPSMPRVDAPEHPVGLVAQEYLEAEQELRESGVPFVILRVAPYTERHVVERFLPVLAARSLRINTGAGTAAFISRHDVARTAVAAVLAEGASVEGNVYEVAGPQLLSFADLVELVTSVTGVVIEHVELDDDTFLSEIRTEGYGEPMCRAVTGMGRAIREGYFAVWSDAVRDLTGRPPRSVLEILEACRDQLGGAARGSPSASS